MREGEELSGNKYVRRSGKLVGFHVALRLSAKKPYCYPAVEMIGKALGISPRHVAITLKELGQEEWVGCAGKLADRVSTASIYDMAVIQDTQRVILFF